MIIQNSHIVAIESLSLSFLIIHRKIKRHIILDKRLDRNPHCFLRIKGSRFTNYTNRNSNTNCVYKSERFNCTGCKCRKEKNLGWRDRRSKEKKKNRDQFDRQRPVITSTQHQIGRAVGCPHPRSYTIFRTRSPGHAIVFGAM